MFEQARRAAEELGVEFETIDTTDRETMLRYGRTDEVLVDGRSLQRGAPPSYRTVRRKIARHRHRHRHR